MVGVSDRLMVRFSASPASPLVHTVVSPLHSSRGGPGNGSVAFRCAVVQVSQAAPIHGKAVATRRTGWRSIFGDIVGTEGGPGGDGMDSTPFI